VSGRILEELRNADIRRHRRIIILGLFSFKSNIIIQLSHLECSAFGDTNDSWDESPPQNLRFQQ
jgi:hypothetical protein